MTKSTAQDIARVSQDARRLAERAASRAGVTLEDWLDQAISEQASATERGNPVRASARERPGSGDGDGDFSVERAAASAERPIFRAEGASARDLQERLRTAAGPKERGQARDKDIAARALDSIDTLFGRTSAAQTGHMPIDAAAGAKSMTPTDASP